MEITKILESIKDARIFMKQKFYNKTEIFNIEHNDKNVIQLESDDESDETSSQSSEGIHECPENLQVLESNIKNRTVKIRKLLS